MIRLPTMEYRRSRECTFGGVVLGVRGGPCTLRYSVAWQGQIEPLARAACGGGSRASTIRNTVFLFVSYTPPYLRYRRLLH